MTGFNSNLLLHNILTQNALGTAVTGPAALPRDPAALAEGTVTVTQIVLKATSVEQTTVRASILLHIEWQIVALKSPQPQQHYQ